MTGNFSDLRKPFHSVWPCREFNHSVYFKAFYRSQHQQLCNEEKARFFLAGIKAFCVVNNCSATFREGAFVFKAMSVKKRGFFQKGLFVLQQSGSLMCVTAIEIGNFPYCLLYNNIYYTFKYYLGK